MRMSEFKPQIQKHTGKLQVNWYKKKNKNQPIREKDT